MSDPRLKDCLTSEKNTQAIHAQNTDLVLWGYPDDEGIQMNGGRVGARLAPDSIRETLYKTTPGLDFQRLPRLVDLGNIDVTKPLHERHEKGRTLSRLMCEKNIPFIALGGGHDYGYSDTCGFLDAFTKTSTGNLDSKPLVLNFDAHLDVRPADKGHHSGTPFRRALTEFPFQFEFFEIGLQPQCNARDHWQWALAQGAHLLAYDQVKGSSLISKTQSELEQFKHRPTFLSVDIDAFCSAEAPGCSASWPTGLEIRHFLDLLEWLQTHLNVRGMGIYEVSPPLDEGTRTSRLAALICFSFLKNLKVQP